MEIILFYKKCSNKKLYTKKHWMKSKWNIYLIDDTKKTYDAQNEKKNFHSKYRGSSISTVSNSTDF